MRNKFKCAIRNAKLKYHRSSKRRATLLETLQWGAFEQVVPESAILIWNAGSDYPRRWMAIVRIGHNSERVFYCLFTVLDSLRDRSSCIHCSATIASFMAGNRWCVLVKYDSGSDDWRHFKQQQLLSFWAAITNNRTLFWLLQEKRTSRDVCGGESCWFNSVEQFSSARFLSKWQFTEDASKALLKVPLSLYHCLVIFQNSANRITKGLHTK